MTLTTQARLVFTLPILILSLSLVGCGATEEVSNPGLARDVSVDLDIGGPDQRVSYFNVLETDAPWLTSSDFLSFPRGVAVDDRLGRIYVAEQHGVRMVEMETGNLSDFGSGFQQGKTHGIAVGPDSRVYVVDSARAAVVVFNAEGDYQFEIVVNMPKGIAIDGARDRLYVADAGNNTVSVWTLEGEYVNALTTSGMSLPLQPAINSKGEVYVLSWGDSKLNVWDAEGNYLRGFVQEGTQPGTLLRPKGIAIDSDDNVYVSDDAFGNVQIWTPQDELALIFGSGGRDLGQFRVPGLLTFDSEDRLYVPEFMNNRIQIFEYHAL